ncbi:hypothetical protein ACHAWF_014272 [Thalassiosira exigua]
MVMVAQEAPGAITNDGLVSVVPVKTRTLSQSPKFSGDAGPVKSRTLSLSPKSSCGSVVTVKSRTLSQSSPKSSCGAVVPAGSKGSSTVEAQNLTEAGDVDKMNETLAAPESPSGAVSLKIRTLSGAGASIGNAAEDSSIASNKVESRVVNEIGMCHTNTTLSTCSVATEGGHMESRDASISERCDEDAERDSAPDVSYAKPDYAERDIAPDKTITKAKANNSSRPKKSAESAEADLSHHPRKGGNSQMSKFDSAVFGFYSSLELGAERVYRTMTCKSPKPVQEASSHKGVDELLSKSSVEKGDDQFVVEPQQPVPVDVKPSKEQSLSGPPSTPSNTKKPPRHPGKNMKPPVQSSKTKSAGCMARMLCQEDQDLENASMEIISPNDLINDALSIDGQNTAESSVCTHSCQDTIESEVDREQKFLEIAKQTSPKAQSLLREIDDLESSLFEIRQTASKEKVEALKERQDPCIQRMATIKQLLLDQQTLLQAVPAGMKSEYYRAISHAAMLNAEVETQRAELELKKIRLETLKIDDEMEFMFGPGDSYTFDSMDDTMSLQEMSLQEEDALQKMANFFTKFSGKNKKTKKSGKRERARGH